MAEKAEKPQSIWSFTFVILLVINFFFSMSQMMNNNILPLFARDLGLSATIIGFVVSMFYVAALCARPFTGPAYDSFSKKRLLQISYAVTVIACFLYVFASNLYVLYAARIIHGIAVGCIAPLTLAFVSDIVPVERMGSGVSIYTTAQVLAQVIGPALGIELTRIIGYQHTFLLSAISMALAGILTFFVKEAPATRPRPPYKLSLERMFIKRGVPVALCLLLITMGFSCIISFIAIYAESMGIMQIGMYFIVYAVVMIFTRPFGGKLADRIGIGKVLVPSIALFGISLLILSCARTLPMFIVVAVVAAVGYGMVFPLLQAVVMKLVPRSQSGAASNTNYFALDIGFLSGPLIAGVLIDAFMPIAGSNWLAYAWMFRSAAIPVFLSLVLFLAIRGRIARYEAEASASNE